MCRLYLEDFQYVYASCLLGWAFPLEIKQHNLETQEQEGII